MVDADTIPWGVLAKPVTYQVRAGDRWATVTRVIYATIQNPENRRVLVKATRTIFNTPLMEIPQ